LTASILMRLKTCSRSSSISSSTERFTQSNMQATGHSS
jgi:hypothetical protein